MATDELRRLDARLPLTIATPERKLLKDIY